jgi:hypothetical protein
VNVCGRAGSDAAPARREETDGLRRGHHHPHGGRQLLDPLIISERRDTLAQGSVASRQRGVELERPSHAGSELEHLNLHRDDSSQHHAEQRDPHPAADQAIE